MEKRSRYPLSTMVEVSITATRKLKVSICIVMMNLPIRRIFAPITLGILLSSEMVHAQSDPTPPVRVLIWDERQPVQMKTYGKWIGQVIGDNLLGLNKGIQITQTHLEAPDKGLSESVLDNHDVIIWWGHVRHHEISDREAAPIVERILDGRLSMIALHSAHWATPFMEAMNAKTKLIAQKNFSSGIPDEDIEFNFISPGGRQSPVANSDLTPFFLATRRGRSTSVQVHLPNCCFPSWRADGKSSRVVVDSISHPIAAGLPLQFNLSATEMYAEPFHVPEPDTVIFRELWEKGEWFRSGMIWNIGKGKVFYFRPGHETFPVYTQSEVSTVLNNAVTFLGKSVQSVKSAALPPNFAGTSLIAWCIVPFDSEKRSPEARAIMLNKLGISRVAYDWRQENVSEFEDEILQYKKHGIEFSAFWDYHPEAFRLFEKYNLKPQIWKTAPSPEGHSNKERVEKAAQLLKPVIEECKRLGLSFGLYNHGGWGGEPENLVAVADYIRDNFEFPNCGIVYNFHHAHNEIESFENDLKLMTPYLLCLNLNGMNSGAQPKILTIGSGEHETGMIRSIIHSGYSGPIGIIDHQADKDTMSVLTDNLLGLQNLIPSLIE